MSTCAVFFLMIRRPPRSTRTDTLFPTRRSSDLRRIRIERQHHHRNHARGHHDVADDSKVVDMVATAVRGHQPRGDTIDRSEEHTSELQSLMRISYAGFCLKKKTITTQPNDVAHT